MIPVFCHECNGSGKKLELDPNTDMAQRLYCKTCDGTGVRYADIPETEASPTPEERIRKALELAVSGMNDGSHHKMWVIDQMVRALTGCPTIKVPKVDYKGQPFVCETQGSSAEYRTWVASICNGEDGPDTYEWEVGIAP